MLYVSVCDKEIIKNKNIERRVEMSLNKKIHIKPEDVLERFDEYDDGRPSYVNYYIEPYGPYESNEVSTTYYIANDEVSYHEHSRGIETFLVEGGSVEATIRGKRAIAHKGDIIHLQPYVSHKFKYLETWTVWREIFQEIQMNQGLLEERRIQELYPELGNDEGFKAEHYKRILNTRHAFIPAVEDVSVEQIPEIRTFDFGLSEFTFGDLVLKQKVGRWETKGLKEIWQVRLKKDKELRWNERNPFWLLYLVYSGSVRVNVDGEEEFVAKEGDLIHVPNYLAGSIVTNEDTILLDLNVEGFLFRALDELKAAFAQEKDLLKNEDYVNSVLQKNDFYVTYHNL
jgi:Uncharacterized conserved protein, contains double-stranded beta-helix domain